MMTHTPHNLSITALSKAYQAGELTPRQLVNELLAAQPEQDAAWITRLSADQLEPYLARLDDVAPESLPLYGIPFAIKDNIDLAGITTTAGCPEFAYTPDDDAFVVKKLIAAGAIPMGKTNLDQFATGLVGERALPVYGTPANAFDPAYVPGGSSSGSAVVTAQGQVSFALGTDTAGSGRVPACFNNLVGVKPTLGLLSAGGVVPACATLDTISIFALGCDDAARVLSVTAQFDADNRWAREHDFAVHGQAYGVLPDLTGLRIGVPPRTQWHTDADYSGYMEAAIRQCKALGAELVELDCSPLLAAARLLYEGPWVAERYHAVRELIERNPEALHPVTREITLGGATPLAVDAFDARYQLAEYRRQADALLAQVDVMLAPTTPRLPTKAELAEAPIAVNSELGTWTNFMNLLDLSALAVPVGFNSQGLPGGVTLFAPAFEDLQLLSIARLLEKEFALPLGASAVARPQARLADSDLPMAQNGRLEIAVCGAHLSGMPLNHQLTQRDARLVARTHSAPSYRLYQLDDATPAKPAMLRAPQDGTSIALEVWSLPIASVGSFLAGIPFPLGLGQIELEDGRWVAGFICSVSADSGLPMTDISEYGGWKAWVERE